MLRWAMIIFGCRKKKSLLGGSNKRRSKMGRQVQNEDMSG